MEFDLLKSKYAKLEVLSQIAAFVGMFASVGVILAIQRNTPWVVGLLFGWMVIAPIAVIGWSTLRRSRKEWNEFWVFYELKYRVSVGLIFPLFGFLMMVGLVSMLALLLG